MIAIAGFAVEGIIPGHAIWAVGWGLVRLKSLPYIFCRYKCLESKRYVLVDP
jgi:hypothetical protein